MRCRLVFLTRKARGGVARREEAVEAEVLRIGRGADCELHLPDPRVLLHHGELTLRLDGIHIETLGTAEIAVNGQRTGASPLRPGDRLAIGPYDIEVEQAEDADLLLAVELARPLGDDLERLRERSRASLTRVGLGKRAWSWLLAAVALALFLALPLAGYLTTPDAEGQPLASARQHAAFPTGSDVVWLTGEVAAAHRFFADGCQNCHQQAFRQVRDSACLACHGDTRQHADAVRFSFASFEDRACQSCHKEHNGATALVLRDQRLCTDCHVDLERRAPDAGLGDTADFGAAHPPFAASVIVDPVEPRVERLALTGAAKPVERSGLRFPHDKHMDPKGVRHPDKGNVQLDCATCHQPEPGGGGMLPIRMEAQCGECHALRFESAALERTLPHGKPEAAMQALAGYYAEVALRGGVEAEDAPAVVRRRPGQPLGESERLEALAWAERMTAQAAERVFGRSLCGSCHEVVRQPEGWQVTPVRLADHWLPKAQFQHGSHTTMECGDCHEAAESKEAADVLIPDIGLCRDCHGGEKTAGKVASTCVDCHVFHRPDLGRMGSPHGSAGPQAMLPAAAGQ